jgi:hypothetical protein
MDLQPVFFIFLFDDSGPNAKNINYRKINDSTIYKSWLEENEEG